MISRRDVFAVVAAFAARGRAVAGDFWKDRKPEEWSAKDVDRLMNRSPWAKEVVLAYAPGGGIPDGRGGWNGRGGGGGPARGSMTSGSMGPDPLNAGAGRRGSGRDSETIPQRQQAKALVRWESALPIRTAAKQTMPPSAAGHYVLSLSGAPMEHWNEHREDDRTAGLQTRFAAVTSLQAKGSDPIAPDRVARAGSALVFLFLIGEHPFSMDDKEVIFSTRLGPMEIKAKFALKDMVYGGRLEL